MRQLAAAPSLSGDLQGGMAPLLDRAGKVQRRVLRLREEERKGKI
jgi:hypothetical protein